MNTITNIDANTCRALRSNLSDALKTISEELGVNIRIGNARFTRASVTFKMDVVVNNSDGSAQTKASLDFEKHANRYDLKPSDLGKAFSLNGETFTIEGLKPRSHKYPILARSGKNGKLYKLAANEVAIALNEGESK